MIMANVRSSPSVPTTGVLTKPLQQQKSLLIAACIVPAAGAPFLTKAHYLPDECPLAAAAGIGGALPGGDCLYDLYGPRPQHCNVAVEELHCGVEGRQVAHCGLCLGVELFCQLHHSLQDVLPGLHSLKN